MPKKQSGFISMPKKYTNTSANRRAIARTEESQRISQTKPVGKVRMRAVKPHEGEMMKAVHEARQAKRRK